MLGTVYECELEDVVPIKLLVSCPRDVRTILLALEFVVTALNEDRHTGRQVHNCETCQEGTSLRDFFISR